ncbi:hypothetical protein N7461_005118 [Penicillium sp. DV-2018c]|nr:hypothetical protein N7461_005118 [Penicillium sp. DV-2018c]
MQPDSEERASLDEDIRTDLKKHQDVETANVKIDENFQEEILSLTGRLSSEQFTTLADLCNRRQQGSCRTLYCVGPAGGGKTFLSSAIIDHLQRTFTSPDVATIFIFCQEGNGKEQPSTDILKNILAQLVYRKRSLSYATSSLYHSESLRKDSASPKAYHNAIRAEIERFAKVIIVIDGLDMFSENERILGRLQKLPQQAQLLVTLRDMDGIRPAESSGYMSVVAPPEDIGLYVLSRTRRDSYFRRHIGTKPPDLELEDDIIHSVIDSSRGIFLLAKLHLDLLSHYKDRTLLRRGLGYLPENLSEAYGEAMKQVVSVHPLANRYIYWVLYAARPLTVTELRSAVGESETFEISRPMSFEHYLLVKTAGLLEVDAVSGTVRFVHRTAKEYLGGSAARVFFPTAQRDIAEACLMAISCDEVIDDCYRVESGLSRPLKEGFLDYAATYWGDHFRQVDEEEMTVLVLIKTFLNKLIWRRPPLSYAAEKANCAPTELGIGKYPIDWSGLHVLSFFGIPGKARRLIEQGTNINDQNNSLGFSPLHCAALQGKDEMIAFLLDNGAKVNAVSADGKTALHLAAERGYRKCMKLLFAHRADPRIVDRTGATCLQTAVGTATDESTLSLLVKHKVNLNSQNPKTGNTTLHLAIQWQRPRIILSLLENGVDIDIANHEGMTPPQLAANTDNCEAVALILQHCTHIDARRSLVGTTALQYAAWKGHWTAFDLLLIGGADINVWNGKGETLLHEQSQYSKSTSVASKLLDGGADIEALTSQGETPLQCAAMCGNKTMFNFLLKKGARLDVETAKGETLLHITPPVNQHCLDILETALKEGISVAATSSQGWTPLHRTVYAGTGVPDLASDKTAEYIQLLISHGASVNDCAASNYAETPLHLAVMAPLPRPSLVQFLIQQGANVNAATTEGQTALILAAERAQQPIFRILLDAGADLSVKIPTSNSNVTSLEEDTPLTALEIAKINTFEPSWSNEEGKLRPRAQRSGRDSATTVFEDMWSDIFESDMDRSEMGQSEMDQSEMDQSEMDQSDWMARSEIGESETLVGSENNYVTT